MLLRELRRHARPSVSAAPRVLGTDEWAWKKGHRYGTILCDLEQGRVIDLLPDRSTETVAAWLRQHPSVEVVSRDRAGSFGAAIARGAPALEERYRDGCRNATQLWREIKQLGFSGRACSAGAGFEGASEPAEK